VVRRETDKNKKGVPICSERPGSCRYALRRYGEELETEFYTDANRTALLVPIWLGVLAVHR
jgi:hypothetical protein